MIDGNPERDRHYWQRCLQAFDQLLSKEDLEIYIAPLLPMVVDKTLYLKAPNNLIVNHVNKHWLQDIKAVVQRVPWSGQSCLQDVKVALEQHLPSSPGSSSTTSSKRELGKSAAMAFKSDKSFDNFVPGSTNKMALLAAQKVAAQPGIGPHNPLCIYGSVGVGKTHLILALGNEIRRHNPEAVVIHVPVESFVSEMIGAIKRNTMDAFKNKYRKANVLLLDDVQFLADKGRSQEEIFYTINALLDAHQQVVLTTDRYPKELDGLEERLKSRFSWGLTVAIDPPDLETRVAIFLSKADHLRAKVPMEVAFFVARQIQSNVRELEGALNRIIAYAQFMGQPITVDLASRALSDILSFHNRSVSIETIQKEVARYYCIKISDLSSKRRHRLLAEARQMAMLLAKEMTSLSLADIGRAFGGRDHTTVLHGVRKMQEAVKVDSKLTEDYDNLLKILSG